MCSKGLPLPSGGPPNSISTAGAKLCTGAVRILAAVDSGTAVARVAVIARWLGWLVLGVVAVVAMVAGWLGWLG